MRSLSARPRAERFPEEDAVDERKREKRPMATARGEGVAPEGATRRDPRDRGINAHVGPIGPLVDRDENTHHPTRRILEARRALTNGDP